MFPAGRTNPSQYPRICSSSCAARATALYPGPSVVRDRVTPMLLAYVFNSSSVAIDVVVVLDDNEDRWSREDEFGETEVI